jgi:hypothetical protein
MPTFNVYAAGRRKKVESTWGANSDELLEPMIGRWVHSDGVDTLALEWAETDAGPVVGGVVGVETPLTGEVRE